MGCDIHGYIEVKQYFGFNSWDAAMDIKTVVGRNYGIFAALFGVRNYDEFAPAAADRGLPEDVSEQTKREYEAWESDAHSASYITLQEINAIDWEEHGTTLSQYISIYKEGETVPSGGFIDSSVLTHGDHVALARGETIVKEYDPFERSKVSYRRNFAKKADSKSGDWELIFSIMQQLQNFYDEQSKHYASCDENIVDSKPQIVSHVDTSRVRLVVWFDN